MTAFLDKAQKLIALLKKSGKTIAAAESCTGGAFMHALVKVPGASEVFRGGIVAYCDDVKVNQLGVDPMTIQTFGVVSEQTAKQMAQGTSRKFACDISIAVTGYTHTGKVCFAICAKEVETFTQDYGSIGRVEVIDASVNFLLDKVYEKI